MANLIRRESGQTPARTGHGTWDPFRLMESMLGWDPVSALLPTSGVAAAELQVPRFDVKETKESYVFTADLPGIKDEDLDISLTANQLVVSGKRELEESKESEKYHLYERSYGQFSRSFTLPDGIDPERVTAHLKDGVLTLTVGKKPEVQPRRIQISGKAATSA